MTRSSRVGCLPLSRCLGPALCAAVTFLAGARPFTAAETVLIQAGSPMDYRANGTPDEIVLFEIGSSMRYLANAADPGTGQAWKDSAFDDSGWATGFYGVGYETMPPGASGLLMTTVPAGTRSVFTRVKFEVPDTGVLEGLLLGVDYDDGFVAYVNGVEVARSSSMPAGDPAWDAAPALHESSNAAVPNYGAAIDISALALPVLVPGENVLAIGVWNANVTSTDLVLVPRLSLTPNWTRPDFLPATWSAGVYGVGYETQVASPNASALLATTVAPGTFSVFTRASFEVVDPLAIDRMFLGVDYDDGAVAWINGQEVFASAEVPFGPLPFNTSVALHESSNGATPNYSPLHDISAYAAPALVSGTNLLAIGVWNSNAPASTDLVLVPRLSIGEADPCDGLDNDADGTADEGYPDSDGDGPKDCADPDDDNDGIVDGFDCAPLDPAAAAPPPGEVQNMHWRRDVIRRLVLEWDSQGQGVTYDLATGLLSALKSDGGIDGAACLAEDLALPRFDDPRGAPPVGDGYFYVDRAQKTACGDGSYGLASSGEERTAPGACL
jgi:hypothetical protein